MRQAFKNQGQTLIIKRNVPGHTDNNSGVYVEGGLITIGAIKDGDIQPASGRRVTSTSQSEYEATHTMYVFKDFVTWEEGYSDLRKGDIVVDELGNNYTVHHPGDWTTHYKSIIEEGVKND